MKVAVVVTAGILIQRNIVKNGTIDLKPFWTLDLDQRWPTPVVEGESPTQFGDLPPQRHLIQLTTKLPGSGGVCEQHGKTVQICCLSWFRWMDIRWPGLWCCWCHSYRGILRMLHHEMLLMENLYLTFYCFRVYTAVEMLLVTNCFTELQPELVTISHPHTLSCHFVR